MKPENAIEVKNVKKRFKVYYDKGNSLKEKVLFTKRNRHEVHWVLKGISFEVKKGEAIGLIGKNGCGKSTTLKMLTKIMYPTEGSIELRGRVSSLIELGAGFHPDMSGRENIYTNASIFGLTHSEIDKRVDDIIEFSELEEFIDNPVRTYSSGMYMRLAFAVAINVDADILLIDEILAVGDVSFQEKCFEKLKEIKAKGTTIVIVSHAMSQIEMICNRCIWIEDGLIKEDGELKSVCKHYLDGMQEKRMERIQSEFDKKIQEDAQKKEEKDSQKNNKLPSFCRKDADRRGNQKIRFCNGGVFGTNGKPQIFFESGDAIHFHLEYEADVFDEGINIAINFTRDDGVYCFGSSYISGRGFEYLINPKEKGEVEVVFNNVNLLEGRYLVDIAIQNRDSQEFDYISRALEFRIKQSNNYQNGIVNLERHWREV